MFSKRFLFIQITFIVLLLSSFWLYQNRPKPLPVLGVVANFKLKSSTGEVKSLTDLKGKVWVADFMFTSCGNICPMMTKNMSVLHRIFRPFQEIRLVSFSVNPENDTPEVLQKYAVKYQADPKQWFFLTGSREDITHIVVNSFKLGDIKEPIFHSSYFAVVDRQGQIRGYYEGTDEKAIQQTSKDLVRLLKEK